MMTQKVNFAEENFGQRFLGQGIKSEHDPRESCVWV